MSMWTMAVCPVPRAAAKAVNVSIGFSSCAAAMPAPARKRKAVRVGTMVLRGRMASSFGSLVEKGPPVARRLLAVADGNPQFARDSMDLFPLVLEQRERVIDPSLKFDFL